MVSILFVELILDLIDLFFGVARPLKTTDDLCLQVIDALGLGPGETAQIGVLTFKLLRWFHRR